MSAAPSGGPGGPNGQKPTPPPKAVARIRRHTDNPLVAKRKHHTRPLAARAPGTPVPAALKNAPPKPATAPLRTAAKAQPNFEESRKVNGGWSFPKPEGAQEYPIVLSKKSLREGLRFHIMRLVPPQQKAGGIDPTDQNRFTRPVTLHRRDPRQPPPGREIKPEEEELPEPTPEQTEESERLARIKADREAQRAIDDAQKAPVMKDPEQKKQPKQKERKPGTQIHYAARTEKQKKESEIRYEEALPWHLEDADGKNVWVGQYEAPLSDAKVAFIIQPGSFRMVPLEKWYKFTSKRTLANSLTIEEAEKVMGKKAPVSRWAMRDAQRDKAAREMAEARIIMNGRVNVKQESSTFQAVSRREKMDHDDIDMSGDEFQDDDETAGFEPDKDEDSKDSKDRVRREQLGANLFGDADEGEVEKEEAAVKKEEEAIKLHGKEVKRFLKRRDKQFQYDSDDSEKERDPFAPSSGSDSDSELEGQNEDDKDGKDKLGASGQSSKGNNTPQGKKAAPEAAKKGKSLKRAGSPIVSDSSGTESTRKKKKKTGPTTSSMTGSRSTTPLPRRPGPNSTSDGEGTAGEMSDGAGGKKKKIGTHLGTGTSSRGTPVGSRAASPAPVTGNTLSPAKGGASTPGSPAGIVTAQDIINALPPAPGGVTIGELLKTFRSRVGDGPGRMPQSSWIQLVKQHAQYDNKTKTLARKT